LEVSRPVRAKADKAQCLIHQRYFVEIEEYVSHRDPAEKAVSSLLKAIEL
jgi:hypothetical protein